MTDAQAGFGPKDLDGLGVLVTRPAHQAGDLCRELARRGAVPARFPVIEIEPTALRADERRLRGAIADADIVVFVSSNAVHALREVSGCMPTSRPNATNAPNSLNSQKSAIPAIAAIGAATRNALADIGLAATIVPESGYGSEALLALPAFSADALPGRRVAIVKGEGGREGLARTLLARGAFVDELPLYRRVRPSIDPTVAAAVVAKGRRGDIGIVTLTSGDGARNFFEIVTTTTGDRGRDWLVETNYAVLSRRIAGVALALGVAGPLVVAHEASDAGLISAILAWWRDHPERRGKTVGGGVN